MKKLYIFIAGLVLGLGGCAEKPTEAFAKEYFKKQILTRYTGRAEMIGFKKIKAGEGIFFGVKSYEIEYDYELACNASIQIKELEMISVDDVERMDEFLKAQTGAWEKLNFAPFSNVRIDSTARDALYKAYTGKKSLLICRIGEKVQGTARTRFLLRENGWDAESR